MCCRYIFTFPLYFVTVSKIFRATLIFHIYLFVIRSLRVISNLYFFNERCIYLHLYLFLLVKTHASVPCVNRGLLHLSKLFVFRCFLVYRFEYRYLLILMESFFFHHHLLIVCHKYMYSSTNFNVLFCNDNVSLVYVFTIIFVFSMLFYFRLFRMKYMVLLWFFDLLLLSDIKIIW